MPFLPSVTLMSLTIFVGVSAAYAGYRTPPHPMSQLTNEVAGAIGRRLLKATSLPTKYGLRGAAASVCK